MAPERSPKRVKTSPIDQAETSQKPEDTPLPATPATNSIVEPQKGTPADSRRSSWYMGTWPRKAAPITEVARESISSASNAATEALASVKRSTRLGNDTRSSSLAMTLGKKQSAQALPAEVTRSTVHATPESTPRKASTGSSLGLQKNDLGARQTRETSNLNLLNDKKEIDESPSMGTDSAMTRNGVDQIGTTIDQSQPSWFPWLSKPNNASTIVEAPKYPAPLVQTLTETSRKDTPEETIAANNASKAGSVKTNMQEQSNKRSWLQMWGSETPNKSTPPFITGGADSEPAPGSSPMPIQASKLKADANTTATSQASSMETAPPQLPGDSMKSAAWVFWSRAQKDNGSSASIDQPHVGEIAISDTPSAGRPKRASFSVPANANNANVTANKDTSTSSKILNHAKSVSKSSLIDSEKQTSGGVSKEDKKDMETSKIKSTNATAATKAPAEAQSLGAAVTAAKQKKSTAQLLPLFADTFAPQRSPTLLEQIGRLLNYTKSSPPRHLNPVKDPPRIKNALAIGVHGYFPAPLVRTILGQPTGTSIKFADMAAKSIKSYTKSQGYECSVKTAALEGEGKIAERIDLLWKLLLNWVKEIQKADFVMVACHSQGVPVAIMLVAKLIDFGCVNSARIGICAMAGVSMGPFLEYKSRWISGSAGELFEFSDPSSTVSTNYISALQTVLKSGCRVLFIGSIDDQLVSLESSMFSSITHPHIYRAVLIDGRTHTPNFLSHLVGFALKLRNLGVLDHGLIRELSNPLAGSLYTGQGHSMIYEESSVYDLAVSFALETTELRNVSITQSNASTTARNPYILPFALRGMLEEEFVKTELHDEAEQLLRQFDDWKPGTKVLQDVKFRLEGIRSRL